MNDCKFSGRPTRDPQITHSQGADPIAIARYTLAVERKSRQENGPQADFLNIIAFGRTAEFVEKHIRKGMKIIVECHAQSGSYEKDGKKVYYTEFVADSHEFCEKKEQNGPDPAGQQDNDGFMNIPDGIDSELPFN